MNENYIFGAFALGALTVIGFQFLQYRMNLGNARFNLFSQTQMNKSNAEFQKSLAEAQIPLCKEQVNLQRAIADREYNQTSHEEKMNGLNE